LVDRVDVNVVVPGTTTTLRRVTWRALPLATQTFKTYDNTNKQERSAGAVA